MADHSQAERTYDTTSMHFALTTDVAVQQMDTQTTGLDSVEALRRLQQYGPNRLPEGSQRSALSDVLLYSKKPDRN